MVKHVKLMYLQNLLLYSCAWIRQTTGNYIVMMSKESTTIIVSFMTLQEGDLVEGHDHISHIPVVKIFSLFKNHLLYC